MLCVGGGLERASERDDGNWYMTIALPGDGSRSFTIDARHISESSRLRALVSAVYPMISVPRPRR